MGRFVMICVTVALVGCSSSVKVEDATVTLPRVAVVTATPALVREDAPASRAASTEGADAATTGGNGAAPRRTGCG